MAVSRVLIAEPDEVNVSRIRTILESLELDFEYELVTSAEAAIASVERRIPDVFIGDMQMPVISAAELFSMIEMMTPDTVRIVMTDGGRIQETVEFMNECRIFKIIMKPCRVADDLLVPINAALTYKRQLGEKGKEKQAADDSHTSLEEEYAKLCTIQRQNTNDLKRAQSIIMDMISANIDAGTSMDEKVRERVKRWYQWMIEEYVRQVINGSGDYEQVLRAQIAFCDDPIHNNTFFMKKNTPNEIEPKCMNVIAYVLRLVTGVCKDLQIRYRIQAVIDEADKAYILRVRYQMEKTADGAEVPSAYRVRNEEIRRQIRYATELGIAATGCKTAVVQKETEDILNVAIVK